ncbi:MAG: ABC transporter ATP-binding protein [Syntrophomonadaceae bacterium]|nr:ABC transporter ATP-binding protein [Syntrophomonadaceae bacterium]
MAVLEIQDLTYYYPGARRSALHHINLTIPPGQFVLVVGGSGSGKSSLLRAISRLIPDFYGGAYKGRIYLGGMELRELKHRDLVEQVGLVFQDPESQMITTSVEGEVAFGLENLGLSNHLMKRRVMEATSALRLTGCRHRFIPELSGGEKQKVALASILAMQPEIVLLDEPTSQLDPVAGEDILALLRRLNEENGITVVLIEQRLERCFHLADRVLVMEEGRIVFDHDSPGAIASWAVENGTPFVPPLVKLFAGVGYIQAPVTVKEGREILRRCGQPDLSAVKKVEPASCGKPAVREGNGEQPLVDIEGLWFTYPNGEEALKNINLRINPGDFIVLMGDTGAGKTTLIKTINGLLRPGRGRVKFRGQDIRQLMVEDLASTIGYLSQNPGDYLFLPTVREELAFTLGNLGLPDNGIVDTVLDRLQLTACADANPRDLSTGERQRVALASILVGRPRLLLLDEPTRGLDYELKQVLGEILQELQAEDTAVAVVTHDVEFAAEYAEDVVLMADGAIIARGSKYEMLTGSTFYSPQVNKLFNGIADQVVTLAEGKMVLDEVMNNEK